MANNEGPTRSGFVDTPDGRVHYRERGASGPPVVFLDQIWERVMELFPPGYRLIAVDALRAVDGLGLEKFCLVGHGAGALVAAEYAAMHAQKVEGLVLVACVVSEREEFIRSLPLISAPTVCAVGDREPEQMLTWTRQVADVIPNGVYQELYDSSGCVVTEEPAIVTSVVYGLVVHCTPARA